MKESRRSRMGRGKKKTWSKTSCPASAISRLEPSGCRAEVTRGLRISSSGGSSGSLVNCTCSPSQLLAAKRMRTARKRTSRCGERAAAGDPAACNWPISTCPKASSKTPCSRSKSYSRRDPWMRCRCSSTETLPSATARRCCSSMRRRSARSTERPSRISTFPSAWKTCARWSKVWRSERSRNVRSARVSGALVSPG